MDESTASDTPIAPSDPPAPTRIDTPEESPTVPVQEVQPVDTPDDIGPPPPAGSEREHSESNPPLSSALTAQPAIHNEQPISPLFFPFRGTFPVTFSYGVVSDDDTVKKQHAAWGLKGHNGVDFALPEGTEVHACADGDVVHAGDNGGYGTCIIIRHPWGTSLYGHLQECKRAVGASVQTGDLIGTSGKTGFVTGAHLHFGIQPNNADRDNGYGGFINPMPFLHISVEDRKNDAAPDTDPAHNTASVPPSTQNNTSSNALQPTTHISAEAQAKQENQPPAANNTYMRKLREKSPMPTCSATCG